MDIATNGHTFTNSEIEKINRCRIFLKVVLTSDVSSADGKSIQPPAFACLASAQLRSPTQWPIQPRPGPGHRKTWSKFLQSLCKPNSHNLQTPLGPWIRSISKQQWLAFYDSSNDQIITCIDLVWKTYKQYSTQRRYWTCINPSEPFSGDTHGLIPLDIVLAHRSLIRVSIPSQMSIITPLIPIHTTWFMYLASLPQWEQDLLKSIQRGSSQTSFRTRLRADHTSIHIVSDGSFLNGNGTFGWIIASSDEILFSNSGHIAHPSSSPFRSECFGILSWLVFIKHYMIYFQVPSSWCTMTPYCDNLSTIPYMSTEPLPWRLAKPLRPHYDVTNEIRQLFRLLQHSCPNLQPGRHVKGHQDSSPDQSYPEQLNIQADSIARSAQLRTNTASPFLLPHCSALLQACGINTFCDETGSARWFWRDIEIQRYYMDRFSITSLDLRNIAWPALSKSLSMLPPPLHIFSTKLVIGWLSSGTRLKKYGNAITLRHRCQQQETSNHIFQCQGREAANTQLISDLKSFLLSVNTKPSITSALIHYFKSWLFPHRHFDPIPIQPDILQCIVDQNTIGWHLAARGLFSLSWTWLQEADDPSCKPLLWQSKLTSWIINQAHSIWTDRNNEIYHPEGQATRMEQETRAQVAKVYELADAELNIHDRNILFSETVSQRQQRPESSNRIWVRQMYSAVRNAVARANRNHGLQDIRNFFQRAPPPAPPTDHMPTTPTPLDVSEPTTLRAVDQPLDNQTSVSHSDSPTTSPSPSLFPPPIQSPFSACSPDKPLSPSDSSSDSDNP
jgi:hypothetical protein